MHAIQTTINPADAGPQVANLYAALQFLIDKNVFASLAPPELAALKDQLRSEQPSGFFKGAAVTLVQLFQIQAGLGDGLGGVVEDQTADLLNQQLKKLGAFDTGVDFVVRGTVKDANGSPQGGLVVIAFDRDLRRWQELGRAATDPMGRFEIPYRYESFRQAEGQVQPELDLVLQVARRLDNEDLEPLFIQEEPRPVPPVATVDVVIPAPPELQPSEFERVTDLVTPLLVGQGDQLPEPQSSVRLDPPRYTDLAPHAINGNDVAFILRETGLEAELVRAWAEGARWQKEALRLLGADARPGHVAVIEARGWPFFFAWIRAGQAPGLMGVLRSDAQAWFPVQRNGEALKRIPRMIKEDWELLLSALRELANLAAVDDTLSRGEPLVELLRQSPDALPRELKLEALDIYRTQGLGDPDAFLKLADLHPAAAKEVGTFVRTLRLNDLTGGQVPLIGALNDRLRDAGDSIQPLADMGRQAWADLVGVAVGQGLAVEASAHASVAAGLQLRVEQLYPLPSLEARLGDGSVVLADPELDSLRGILDQHREGADALLKGKNLDSPAVKAIDNLKVIDALRNFGRFGRLGLGFEGAADLYKKGIPNPGFLTRFGSDQIRDMLLNKYPQELVDAFTNNVTNAVSDITSMLATGVSIHPSIFGASGAATAQPPVVQQITGPTVRGMFGDLDECMCRPCESVLGLPAYLVDLLNLLGKASATGFLGRTAQDVLWDRRPSILTMPLSCENAETEVLHIDLALEVLEDAVPASAGTGTTAAARAANALQRARFPWTLPFNAADTDLEACMERLGTTQHELMSLVVAPTAIARATAILGLPNAERELIAGQPLANWWELWGFATNASIPFDDPASNEAISGTPQQLLRRASVLMARSGLGLDALETALATDFVGGLAFSERDQCKTSKMRLPQQATPAPFDRLHRFTRLHRRLPDWNAAVLDSALKQLNGTPVSTPLLLDDDVLNGIAQVKRAAEALHLPVEAMLALRAWPGETRVSLNLADRTKDETLFDRVFSSKRQVDQQRFAAVKRPGSASTEAIAGAADAIAAAIGMDPRTVVKHATAAGSTISHASLTWLYRHHTLSRALGLSIDQLLRLMQVTGIQPFLLPTSTVTNKAQGFAALSALAQASRQIADSGLPFDLALALLQPDAPVAELPPGLRTARQIDGWLEALKRALQGVPAPADLHVEDRELFDPIKRLLSLLFKGDVVDAVMAELVSPSGNSDQEVTEALTSRLDHSALRDRSPLVSKDEAVLLLTPDSVGRWREYERFAFVYERLLERVGDMVRRVEAALANLLPSGQVKHVLDALHDATSPSRTDAFLALTTPAVAGKTFGLGRAVFLDRRAAKALFSSPPQPPQTRTPRYREVLENIAEMQREQVLLDAVVGWTGWPEVNLAPFLGERLTIEQAGGGQARLAMNFFLAPAFWGASAPPLPSDDAAAAKRWPRRLDRLTVLFNRSDAASAWQALPGLDWRDLIEPDAASAPAWSARAGLLDLLWLARPENVSLNMLVEHFKRVSPTGVILPDALKPLAARLNAQPSDVLDLAKIARTEPALTSALTAADLKKPQVLRATFELAMRARHLKATAAQIDTLAGGDLAAAARVARQLLAAQVGAEAWPARIQPIDDALRKQRRDALVAWLLQNDTVVAPTQNRKPWTQSGQIYEHYLIDPEVQPCMRTTRILQAVAAVQLFVQRILFGLEKEVTDSSLLRERWTWMRSYRLWEANRKVFLYPENWLFPELRDDKSSSFRLLESTLGQGELNDERARQAFGAFLDDVAQMGQVQVLGMFDDAIWDSSTPPKRTRRTLYVVGRTTNPPYLYYWRRCDDFGGVGMEWSGWHRIELEIQGDHVLPYVHGGVLCLAWPLLTEGQSSGGWQLTFHWSRLDGRNWRRAESARAPKDLNPVAFRSRETAFTFRCFVENDRIRLGCYGLPAPQNALLNNPAQAATVLRSGPLNTAVRGEFNGHCQAQKIWRYGHVVANLESPGRIEVHSREPANDAHMDAIHSLEWECWIKAKDNNGNTGYVRLDSDPGGVSNPRFHLQSSIGGSSAFARPLGVSLGFWVVAHANRFTIPIVACCAEYRFGAKFFSSTTLMLPSVPNGQYHYSHLRMVIEPPAGSEPSLAELGISVPASNITPIASFVVPEIGQGAWEDPTHIPLPQFHSGTSALMNGMQGGNRISWPLALPFEPPNFSSLVVAAGSVSSQTPRSYWLLPVSDQPVALRGSTAWFYSEAAAWCFLDVRASSTPASVAGYAAAFTEVGSIRRSWQETQSLDAAQALRITYGASLLPAPTVDSALWQGQVDGTSAFDLRMPNSGYSWEVFLQAPLLVADQLTKQHKFEDAERWLRFVFDPTRVSATDPKAFLRFRVFHELNTSQTAAAGLTDLARAAENARRASLGLPALAQAPADVEVIKALIDRWRGLPFRPFVIARRRHVAFLWRTLFAYLDNLITWADSLYRRDTREAIGEATLLYALAARILGPRPRIVGTRRTQSARSFEDLRNAWDEFANAWIDTRPQTELGEFRRGASGSLSSNDPPPPPEGFLHFCIPINEKLLTYWNSVEERLFYIRHCRNIEGITRDLPLLDPPIDPELLIRATDAGLNIGAVLSDLYAPPPNHRFSLLAAKAAELASETRSLGAALLAALEKRDAEKLGLLRSGHEINLHTLVGAVRKLQIDEAEKNIDALRASRKLAESRYQQYGRLLGKPNSKAPEPGDGTTEDSMLGPADKSGDWGLLSHETEQLANLRTARTLSDAESVTRTIAAAFNVAASVAHIGAVLAPPVLEAVAKFDSGGKAASAVASGVNSIADVMRALGQGHQSLAGIQATTAGHIRRRDEWAFQSNQTLKELEQIDKQILANRIRIDIARKELENQTIQIEQAAAIDEYLRSKYTNAELYDWMVSQLSALHSSAYRMALDMARKAQQSARRELGMPALDLIRNDHWNTLRSGLLAGERLHQDIKRLEITYLEQNRREYELTKHVSLRRLDPLALLQLKASGACELDLPEWLFDMDTPGHYMRRIKMVSVSIPCVVGPYASVNCKLTLMRNEVRHLSSAPSGYAKAASGDDPRFTVRYGAAESIVTSTGRDDSGLFETALRDERYLPFESAGVISRWRLELPGTPRQYDFGTISDVILHIRYTARDGGEGLKVSAQQQFTRQPRPQIYPQVLLSCRSEFPNEWSAAKANNSSLNIGLSLTLLPYWMQTHAPSLQIRGVSTVLLPLSSTVAPTPNVIWRAGDPQPSGLQLGDIKLAEPASFAGVEDLFVLLDVG